jgi:uncharacterized protein involved in response to NO
MGPVWSSGFRPFFLASAIYGPAIMFVTFSITAIPGFAVPVAFGALWHGHELLCGWGGALIGGFLLTALPSWAGINAMTGLPLVFLFLVWTIGRVAMWLQPFLPVPLVAILDLAFFVCLAAALVPGLLQAKQKRYRALLVILAALFCGNLLFHIGLMRGDMAGARLGLQAFLGALTFLFSVVAGFLTPVFTENGLRYSGYEASIPINMPLEVAAAASMLLYLLAAQTVENANLVVAAGTLALVVHAVRMARWFRPGIFSLPLVWVLHLAYAWLLVSILLRVLNACIPAVPASASVHAFTVGALSLMQFGLLCRVTLRHTGRPPVAPQPMVVGMYIMLAAAGLRVAGAFAPASPLLVVAAALWVVPPFIYLACHGQMLIAPSLPRSTA